MAWIIDTDVFIEGERGNPHLLTWLASVDRVATADVVRGEFLLGVHAVADDAKRRRGLAFYQNTITLFPSIACEPADYAKAAELAGAARRNGKGGPSLVDGLIAAVALRCSATVATRNTSDFAAMGCPCLNPLA